MPTLTASSTVTIETHSAAVFFCREFARRTHFGPTSEPRVLVAGCGAGHEAAYISECFPAQVEAFDIEHNPDPELLQLPRVSFRAGSAEETGCASESFDAVFYHHVIEHVSDPQRSLRELARVLRPGGWMFLGTPNRHRVVSAAGAHRQRDWSPSLRSKFRENWQDWSARLQGRFRNELGAHAGFSQGELDALLAPHFAIRQWVTREYLRCKYLGRRGEFFVRAATTDLFRWCLAPSIYVFCQKTTSGSS